MHPLQDDFHAEIQDHVKQGVLEKVEHSTEWVNSFIIVEKNVSIDSRKYSNSKSQIQEEVMNLSGSKRSQWNINMQALLFLICG